MPNFLTQISYFRIISRSLQTNRQLNAGHSKWSNIRHIKALKDKQKSSSFTRISRQIRLAVQDGGSINPVLNRQLRNAIDDALRKNMPMASIQSTIKKFEQSKLTMKKYTAEVRGFSGIYAIILMYTDNLAGLKMQITPIMKKVGVSFANATHLFDERGLIELKISQNPTNLDVSQETAKKTDFKLGEVAAEIAIEVGAEDYEIFDEDSGHIALFTDPIELEKISQALREDTLKQKFENVSYVIENAECVFEPKAYVNVTEDDLKKFYTFKEKLKACDGLEEIYDNIQPSEI